MLQTKNNNTIQQDKVPFWNSCLSNMNALISSYMYSHVKQTNHLYWNELLCKVYDGQQQIVSLCTHHIYITLKFLFPQLFWRMVNMHLYLTLLIVNVYLITFCNI